MQLIGRKEEQETLKHLMQSSESRLAVVYGRRRIGKTFLVRSFFKQTFDFEITGLHNGNFSDQLSHFTNTIATYDYKEAMVANPTSWMDAFKLLTFYLDKLKGKKKKVLFFDELPWFDTPKSKFLMAFEHFWNAYCSKRKDILVIVCGSSASWILKKILQNKGGLHNRVSEKILLQPFSLKETEHFLHEKGVKWTEYDIAQIYMTLGGIPYYLDAVRKGESVAQSIDRLCFNKTGLLYQEYDELYSALFGNSEKHRHIIEILSNSKWGMTREQLIEKSGFTSGGGLTTVLGELLNSGFITMMYPYGAKHNKGVLRVDDFFTLFYLKFMRRSSGRQQESWTKLVKNQSWVSWSGLAFERLCFTHTNQIKKALGLTVIESHVSNMNIVNHDDQGAQIDMLIDRADKVVNLCEIKFSKGEYVIDKAEAQVLRNKILAFEKYASRKNVHLTMITTFGTKDNEYNKELVQNQVTLNQLFS
ncbi:MAG TPA: ATP-binding protein [Saprospiraceae bacterium]|nr:ATP-binding protein [Saprospiraceae bacterium]